MPKPSPPSASLAPVFDIQTGRSADSSEGAVAKALNWLADRHRKGWRQALDTWVRRIAPEGAVLGERLDEDAARALQINATEWLLASGRIFVKGEMRRIHAHLLGPDGPWFSPAQRAWLAQMAERPLALYRVTAVRPGLGMTVVDAIDLDAAPVSVREIAGSRDARVGMLLGQRVMRVDDHWELSGSVYNFAPQRQGRVLAAVAAARGGASPEDADDPVGIAIAREWLAQWFEPAPRPTVVDAATGEAMLLVNDHYRVLDALALAAALAAQPDVEGEAAEGWRRTAEAGGGATRIVASIHPAHAAGRIVLFTRSMAQADATRAWFDALAGGAVQHLTRELIDPTGPATGGEDDAKARSVADTMSPEETTAMLQQVMQQHHARWADEPVPMLGDLTPREAMKTPAGLERVKGLLRYYEDSEAHSAKADGRPPVSYQFLWDELGIGR